MSAFVPLSDLTHPSTSVTEKAEAPSTAKPLIKKFAAGGKYFAYDGNTGIILQLTPITYALVDLLPFDDSKRAAISDLAGDTFSLADLEVAISQLNRLVREHGVFKPVKIRARMLPPSLIREKLGQITGHLGQLTLSLAEQCNLRCSYCAYSGGYVNTRVHNNTMMTWDVAKKAMDFFVANKGNKNAELTFYGGEPLINFPLMRQCIEYMQSKAPAIKFGLTTNGTLLTKKVIDLFVAVGMRLHISLDGPEELHDRERTFAGGQGSFKVILRKVREIKEAFPDYFEEKVTFQCTLRPHDDEAAVVNFFVSNGDLFRGRVRFGRIASGHADYPSEATKSTVIKLEQRYLQKVLEREVHDSEFSILREMFEKPYLMLSRRQITPQGYGETTHSMGACFPGNHRVFVKADGTFQVCEKSNDSLVIGNVNTGFDIEAIARIYERFFELHNQECRRCWAYRFCPSCYVSSTRSTGKFEGVLDERYCSDVRDKWTRYFSGYSNIVQEWPDAFGYSSGLEAAHIPILDD